MLTREQRRQLEAEWSSDDRSIAGFARVLKAAALSIMLVGLVWIGATTDLQDNGQQAAALGNPAVARLQGEGSAMRASRQSFDERRAQWDGKSAKPVQHAASR